MEREENVIFTKFPDFFIFYYSINVAKSVIVKTIIVNNILKYITCVNLREPEVF